MTWRALISSCLLLAASASPAPPSVFGYVQEGQFHPLLVLAGAQFAKYDAKTSLVGTLRNAFDPKGPELHVEKDLEFDDLDADPPAKGRLGEVPGRSYRKLFFELSPGPVPRPAVAPSLEQKRSFLRFFAKKDDWGGQFAEGAKPGGEVAKIEQRGNVQILYATDLDGDGKTELWITYRLMYGEIGRMVWEQTDKNGEWVELANHCSSCD